MRRRTLLAGGVAGLATLPWAVRSFAGRAAKRLVVVFANGGWDQTFALDPKLGNDAIEGPEVDQDPATRDDVEAIQTFGDVPILVNDVKRSAVTRFFDSWVHRTVVVNGIWVGSIAHDPCRWRMLSGRVDGRGPDVTAIAGASLGIDLPLGSIDTSGLGLAGPLAASVGSVGAKSQLEMLLEPSSGPPGPIGEPAPGFVAAPGERDAVRAFLDQRADGHRQRWGRGGDEPYASLREARERADRLLAEKTTLVEGLTIGSSPSVTGLVGTTLELLQGNICSAVLIDSGHRWDTHENNVNQHAHYQTLFSDLDRLVTALDRSGMLDDTLVAVMSEMGRTPRRNAALGKDHWPHASALLIGGGVSGGRVVGGTDDLQESLPVDFATGSVDLRGDLLKYDNLLAGILSMVGVDHEPWMPGIRPFLGAL